MQAYESPHPMAGIIAVSAPWQRVVGAWLRKQLGAELYGMPGYGLTLRGPTPDGFLAAPNEGRNVSAILGKAILAGRFTLSGARLSMQGSGDPWNRPSPTRAFAVTLHRFSWLTSLLTQGEDGAREAMRLFLLWQNTFRVWTPFPWSEEVLPRRLINLSISARRMAAHASPEDVLVLARSMAEQGRHLVRLNQSVAWQADRAVALVTLGCVLSGRVGDSFRAKGLKLLPKALKRTVQADGSHMSRSAEQGLDLLYDLIMLEDCLSQRGLSVPDYVEGYIASLTHCVRALSHPDGSLCAFQGSESLAIDQVAPALVREEHHAHAPVLPTVLEQARYHRLYGRSLTVFVDTGEARRGAFGGAACDHPMSFEVSGGRDKLIVSPGWSPDQSDKPAYRLVNVANTLCVGDEPLLSPVSGRFGELLNFGLVGLPYRLRSRRVDAEDTGTLLEMEHEGWRPKFGLKHERRFYIDAARDELRGEDRLTPIDTKKALPATAPYTIRFTLHPEVQASMARDKKSILLRGPGGRGWWLRHDAREVALEDGHVFGRDGLRKTTLVILRGTCRLDAVTRVRWKLSPAEA